MSWYRAYCHQVVVDRKIHFESRYPGSCLGRPFTPEACWVTLGSVWSRSTRCEDAGVG